MRRKQLFAIILAGALAAGSAPAAVFAAESDMAAMSEEGVGNAGSGEAGSEDGSSDAEAPVTDGADAADAATDTPAADNTTTDETPAADNTGAAETPAAEDPATADTTLPEEVQTQEQTEENKEVDPQEGESTESVEEDTGIVIADADGNPIKDAAGNVVYYKTLQDAIDTVEAYSETNQVTTIIQISKPIVLESTVNVTGKKIEIQATNNVTITRKDDETLSFKEDMFAVTDANSGLTLSAKEGVTLTVSGKFSESIEGATVKVDKGGFVLGENVVLKESDSTSEGAAITCKDGTVALIGGQITGNTGERGAVYSNTDVWVEGNVDVSGNEGCNIYLDSSARIKITGALTGKISFTHANAKDGLGVIYADKDDENVTKDIFKNAVNSNITYEDSKTYKFKIGSDEITALLEKIKSDTGDTGKEPAFALVKVDGSGKWKNHNTFIIQMTVTQDCRYSYFYVDKGTSNEDIKKKYKKVKSTLKFVDQKEATIKGFPVTAENVPEGEPYLVICAKQKSGTQVKMRVIKLENFDGRPAKPQTTATIRPASTPKVTEGTVTGFENSIKFFPGKVYTFTPTGAGQDNQNPVTGDERWIPQYWTFSTSNDAEKHTKWQISAPKGQQLKGKGSVTYTIYIYCKKQVHNGKKWVDTDVVEPYKSQFTAVEYTDKELADYLAELSGTPAQDGGDGGDGSGGDGGTDAELTATAAASAKDAGSKSKSAVSTADESPIGTMSVLAALSLLAGGYVVVRKRKKEEI